MAVVGKELYDLVKIKKRHIYLKLTFTSIHSSLITVVLIWVVITVVVIRIVIGVVIGGGVVVVVVVVCHLEKTVIHQKKGTDIDPHLF